MKKIITILTFLLLATISCKSDKKTETNLGKLQTDKENWQKQVDSLNKKIKNIEVAIKKLDTLKKHQKVTILTLKDTIFNHYISLQGTVASDKNINLHPEMSGIVKVIFVKDGKRVAKGRMLMRLDASVLKNKRAELQNQLALATTTFERQERLWKQKIGSEIQFLNAKTQKEGLEKSIISLNTQIGKSVIRAPFSGVIDKVYAKTGELASPQMPVLRLINLNKMYVEADVPETYLPAVKKGTKVLIDFVSINKQVEARVNEVGNFINPENRSFKIKIDVKNKNHGLKPNLLADIKINDFSAKGVVLPSNLIQTNQEGEHFVYTIEKDSIEQKVVQHIIQIGKEYNNEVLILEGLKKDETIINKGSKFVKNGDVVEIMR